MSTTLSDRTFMMPAAVSALVEDNTGRLCVPCTAMTIASGVDEWRAVSWLPVRQFGAETGPVSVGTATILDLRETNADPLIIVAWMPYANASLFDLIPENRCPVAGAVGQLREMVKAIQSPALRSFLRQVFSIQDVFRYFWTCPASIAHHHRTAGGLLVHSLEVALAASTVRGLEQWQRDLAIVYALLHDIGKLWSYHMGELTEEARRLGHEQVGYHALREALTSLKAADEHTWALLDALLSGIWKRNCKHPAAAIGGIVRAMDQFSTAMYMEREFKRPSCQADELAEVF